MGHLAAGLRRAENPLPAPIRKPAEIIAGGMGRTMELTDEAVAKPIAMTEASLADGLDAALQHASPQVRDFLDAHRDQVNRTLGALQMAGGAAEVLGGGAAIADSGGLAAAAGGWMVAHGAEDWDTGLRMLVSGKAQESTLSQALQGFGLSREASEGYVAAFAGLAPGVAFGMTPAALDAAAEPLLARDALASFAVRPLKLTKDGSFWKNPNIGTRGNAWEIFDNQSSGLILTPTGHKTFDQMSADKTIAASNKTLDLSGTTYNDESRRRVYSKLKSFIDDAADYRSDPRFRGVLDAAMIKERQVRLLIPPGNPAPGQVSQLQAARIYARSRQVTLKVFRGH